MKLRALIDAFRLPRRSKPVDQEQRRKEIVRKVVRRVMDRKWDERRAAYDAAVRVGVQFATDEDLAGI